MKWFEGSIPAAIQTSKQNKSLFIVYISGDDELSTKMNATWTDATVSSLCEQNQCVSVQLDVKSESCQQFSQIYPVVCVPCTFLIGENGVPLDVVGGAVESVELVEKIKNVQEMHEKQLSSVSEAAASSSPQQQTQQLSTSAAAAEAENATAEPSGGQTPDLEDRVARAQELLEQKRQEKTEKEKESEKKGEIERRKLGQQMAELKRWKAEKEQKDIKQQMQKDKEEERKARERVKAQIAKDREERAARYRKEKEERENKKQEKLAEKMSAQKEAEAQASAARSEIARIQFRLPDGSSVTNQFPSSDCLETARTFLSEKVGSAFGKFTFSTMYPKRTFTEADMSQTLLDLQLAPSAILVVVPGGSSSPVLPSGGNGGNFLMVFLAPFIALWTFLYNFIFGSAKTPRGTQNQQQTSQVDSDSDSEPITRNSSRSNRPMSAHPRRGRTAASSRSYREGNMQRLRSGEDDDDMATWNGNSTQQM